VGYRILGSIAGALVLLIAGGIWSVGVPGMRGEPKEPLIWAARGGQPGTIAKLVQSGADPNRLDDSPNGWTPLLHAVHKNQLSSVRALIAAGADIDRSAPNGLTPLALAAAQGEAEIVEELLAAGADPRASKARGWTVLQQAVGSGNPRVVEALLRKNPDLRLGRGPRAWAVRTFARLGGHSEILEMLDRRNVR
jgi:ankyrin repeat protein